MLNKFPGTAASTCSYSLSFVRHAYEHEQIIIHHVQDTVILYILLCHNNALSDHQFSKLLLTKGTCPTKYLIASSRWQHNHWNQFHHHNVAATILSHDCTTSYIVIDVQLLSIRDAINYAP